MHTRRSSLLRRRKSGSKPSRGHRRQRGGNCAACSLGMSGGGGHVVVPPAVYPNPGPVPLPGDVATPMLNSTNSSSLAQDGGKRRHRRRPSGKSRRQNHSRSHSRSTRRHTGRRGTKCKRRRSMRGGGFVSDDLINVGREMQFGVGSAYRSFLGHPAPTNPLPWKGQLA